jgi:molecular chaperone IbpA
MPGWGCIEWASCPKRSCLLKEKTMNALTRFDTQALNRALVGFDQMFDTFESRFASQLNTNYPPYNVVKTDDDHYSVEVAVAGFKKDEITVEVEQEQLTIKGISQIPNEPSQRQYLHKGLSSRDFVRQFTLAEYMVVKGAEIKDGILSIAIERIVPEDKKSRLIDIVEVK